MFRLHNTWCVCVRVRLQSERNVPTCMRRETKINQSKLECGRTLKLCNFPNKFSSVAANRRSCDQVQTPIELRLQHTNRVRWRRYRIDMLKLSDMRLPVWVWISVPEALRHLIPVEIEYGRCFIVLCHYLSLNFSDAESIWTCTKRLMKKSHYLRCSSIGCCFCRAINSNLVTKTMYFQSVRSWISIFVLPLLVVDDTRPMQLGAGMWLNVVVDCFFQSNIFYAGTGRKVTRLRQINKKKTLDSLLMCFAFVSHYTNCTLSVDVWSGKQYDFFVFYGNETT